MKTFITILLIGWNGLLLAQNNVNKTVDASGVKEIKMNFKYPELIKINTWDKDEVSVQGSARINNGANDDAFKINIEKVGSEIIISSEIEGLENLPKKIMIKRGEDSYYFDTDDFNDAKVQAFLAESNSKYNYQMHGVIKEIQLEIFVPKNVALNIDAKYGMVEITTLNLSSLLINARYGGIDISFPTSTTRDIQAKTRYGELFSNLELEVDRSASEDSGYFRWTTVSAKLNGGGPRCDLESKYGNVYLRKQ